MNDLSLSPSLLCHSWRKTGTGDLVAEQHQESPEVGAAAAHHPPCPGKQILLNHALRLSRLYCTHLYFDGIPGEEAVAVTPGKIVDIAGVTIRSLRTRKALFPLYTGRAYVLRFNLLTREPSSIPRHDQCTGKLRFDSSCPYSDHEVIGREQSTEAELRINVNLTSCRSCDVRAQRAR